MTAYVFAAIFTLVAGAVLAFILRRRLFSKTSVKQCRFDLASSLRPFVSAEQESRYLDGTELYATIQKAGGLPVIWKAAGEITNEAIRRKNLCPENQSLAERILILSIQLRIMTQFCLVEAHFCAHFPTLPRVFAWVVARLYCELVSTLQAMPSTA